MVLKSTRKLLIKRLKYPSAKTFDNHFHKKLVLAAIFILSIILLGITAENFDPTKNVAYADSVKGFGVGIYWDKLCTNNTLSLYFMLSLKTLNWTPSAASVGISLNWNYTNQVLSAGELIPMNLTLTVSPSISGITDFNFETVITTTVY